MRPEIVVEPDLSKEGQSLKDWKFHVANGKTMIVQVDLDRGVDHRQLIYNRAFKFIDHELFFKTGEPIKRPSYFTKMRDVAEEIGAQFEYARIDMYEVGGAFYLGEITLCPMGGLKKPKSNDLNLYMGQQWELPH